MLYRLNRDALARRALRASPPRSTARCATRRQLVGIRAIAIWTLWRLVSLLACVSLAGVRRRIDSSPWSGPTPWSRRRWRCEDGGRDRGGALLCSCARAHRPQSPWEQWSIVRGQYAHQLPAWPKSTARSRSQADSRRGWLGHVAASSRVDPQRNPCSNGAGACRADAGQPAARRDLARRARRCACRSPSTATPSKLDFEDRVKLRMARALTANGLPYASLLYVWMMNVPVRRRRSTARTPTACAMIVVESGVATRSTNGSRIRRNVLEDYRRAFERGARRHRRRRADDRLRRRRLAAARVLRRHHLRGAATMQRTRCRCFGNSRAAWPTSSGGGPASVPVAASAAIVLLGAVAAPLFGFSDTWQLVINTSHHHHHLPDGVPDPEHAEPRHRGDADQARRADPRRRRARTTRCSTSRSSRTSSSIAICGSYEKLAEAAREKLRAGRLDTDSPEIKDLGSAEHGFPELAHRLDVRAPPASRGTRAYCAPFRRSACCSRRNSR